MSTTKSIAKDRKSPPVPRLAELARNVRPLTEAEQKKRFVILNRTYGVLSEADGDAFESALLDARRVEQ